MKMKSTLMAGVLLGAGLTLSSHIAYASSNKPKAPAEEVYITGLGHIFSLGVCSLGSGRCVSYLFVESVIADLCQRKARVKVAGHSMGASAAIKLVREVSACGGKVEAAAFLDPLTHPGDYNLPKSTRTLTLYSPGFYGPGEGKPGAVRYHGTHIGMAHDGEVLGKVRRLFDMGVK